MVVENFISTEVVENTKYVYFYRLLKGKTVITYEKESIEVQSYGIEVERQDILNEELVNVQRDCIEHISPYRHKVHNLIRLLYENKVSPLHLIDIAGDYVDRYILDFEREVKYIAAY
ncbi:DUF6514 family protein [Clostridium kluyveri]|uniref:Uncharacterized protein n=2 Tax=Clostridium kluyveri TaxID=1534 RepID=A5N380_CLOK5|nr:DUF6514 family protein [Clostridium kluyveri]EDK35576.1 Conserved hypothetical protein [Clostridium kluyveri DSM 555]